MRVVFTHHITDDTRRFPVRFIPVVAVLGHRKQRPSMYGFKAVANVWKRSADDDTHRIIHIRLTHLVFYIDGYKLARDFYHFEVCKYLN